MIDNTQLMEYSMNMKIMDIILHEIKSSGKSRYVISHDTGIDPAVLCRILKGKTSVRAETADILLAYFGYEVRKVRKGGK